MCKKQMIASSVKTMTISKPSERSNSSRIIEQKTEYEDKMMSTTTSAKHDDMSVHIKENPT